ncbi:MAG: hypothetical protein ACFFAN_05160 [Promethearchaeota archaeon]
MYNKPVHAELRGINDITFPKLDFKRFNFYPENGRGFNVGQMEDINFLMSVHYPGEYVKKIRYLLTSIGALITYNPPCQPTSHDTILIVGEDEEGRSEFIYSLLNLYPEDFLCIFDQEGIDKLAKKELHRKRILYVSDFESLANRKLIYKLANSYRGIEYETKSSLIKIPKMTIVSGTTRNMYLKNRNKTKNYSVIELSDSVKQNILLADFNAQRVESIQILKLFELIKKRTQKFFLDLPSNVSIDFPYRESFVSIMNPYPPNATIFHKKFIRLVKNIAFFNQNRRNYYYIQEKDSDSKIKVILPHSIDFLFAMKIGKHIFANICQDLPVAHKKFVKFNVKYALDRPSIRKYKDENDVLDEEGYYFGRRVFKAYAKYIKEKYSNDSILKKEKTYRRYLLELSVNSKDSRYDCLYYKKKGSYNAFKLYNVPPFMSIKFKRAKRTLDLETKEYIAEKIVSDPCKEFCENFKE